MGRTITMWCLLLVFLSVLTVEMASAVQYAKPAPDFTLNDLNGNKVRLADFKGKVVILNFWATDCEPCLTEMPGLNALAEELKGNGLVVLGISLDRTAQPVKELAEKLHITYPILLDSQKAVYFDSYALFGQPVSIIVDRSGIIQERLLGQLDWALPKLRARIITLLKGH